MKGKSKGKSKGKAVNVPAVVSVEIPTREQIERAREARVKEIRRTLAKCGDEMERGRTRFVLVCDPSHIYAVRQYLAQAWGEYAPKVEAGLIVTAAKKPVNAKAAK